MYILFEMIRSSFRNSEGVFSLNLPTGGGAKFSSPDSPFGT